MLKKRDYVHDKNLTSAHTLSFDLFRAMRSESISIISHSRTVTISSKCLIEISKKKKNSHESNNKNRIFNKIETFG